MIASYIIVDTVIQGGFLESDRRKGNEMKKSEKYTIDEIKALSELSESELDNIVGGTDTEEGKDADDSLAGLCPAKKFCVEHMGRAHRICNMFNC